MKGYLLLFRGGDTERKKLSPEQIEAHMKRWQEWIGGIARKEQFVGGQPLLSEGKVLKNIVSHCCITFMLCFYSKP